MGDLTLTQRIAEESKTGDLSLTKEASLPSIPVPILDLGSILNTVKAIKTILDQREGVTGSVMDMNITLRDLVNAGVLSLKIGSTQVGGRAPGSNGFDPVQIGSIPIGYDDPRPVYMIPPAATNLVAAPAFKNVVLTWDLTDFQNFAYTEIWRANSNALGAAARIGTTTARLYDDASVAVGSTYYYWVRAVSIENNLGPYNAVGGVSAALLTIGSTDIGPLAVTADKLSQGTYPNINLVPNGGAEDGLVSWQSLAADITGAGTVFAIDATDKAAGSQCFQLSKAAAADGGGAGSFAFPVIPGETYSFKARIKATVATTPLYFRVQEKTTKPASGYVDVSNRTSITDLVGAGAVTTSWVPYEFAYTVPAGIYWASVSFYNWASPLNTILKFDDVSFGRQITASFIAAGSIAVGTAAIQNGAIVNAMIGNLAVDTAQIANGAIVNAKIGNLEVDSAKIANATITGGKIAASTITAGNIAAGTITTDRLFVNAATVVSNTTTAGIPGSWVTVSSFNFTTTTIGTLVSTGAPISGNGWVDVLIQNTGAAAMASAQITYTVVHGGVTTVHSEFVNLATFKITAVAWGVRIVLPIAFQHTPAAGTQTYTIAVGISFFDATATALALSGSGQALGRLILQENKV